MNPVITSRNNERIKEIARLNEAGQGRLLWSENGTGP